MLRNKYSVGDAIGVKPLNYYEGSGLSRKACPVFEAKIKYIDDRAIAVEIDQWWIFFNHHGSQFECFREGYRPQYILVDKSF